MDQATDVALSVRTVSKTFPGVIALSGVDLTVQKGHIHALVGGNGSGKSTLAKILSGVCPADHGGSIAVGTLEVPVERWDRQMAREAKVRVVHQDPCIFPDMSVAENLGLPDSYPRRRWTRRLASRRLHDRTTAVLRMFEIDAKATDLAGSLRPAERTMLAIGRALQNSEQSADGLLVLDEPTAALPDHEIELLFTAIRRCARQGQAIVFIGHRLSEILALADAMTVLRNGHVIESGPTAGVDESRLAELIVGRRLAQEVPASPQAVGPDATVLEARNLGGGRLADISFRVAEGEILGIAGLLGSGRSLLLRMLYGDIAPAKGELLYRGATVSAWRPDIAKKAGFGYLPEDRALQGVFPGMNVHENLAATVTRLYWDGLRMRKRREVRDTELLVAEYGIKASSVGDSISVLSGGNQQKVVLGRWLRCSTSVLLLDEPTQGVDVGARADLHALIRKASAKGTAVVVVSSDFAELAVLCDRVLVIRDGRIVAECRQPSVSEQELVSLALVDPQQLAS